MTRYTHRKTIGRPLRVAMLVANTGVGDARVMKEAEGLAAAGHSVTVFCLAGIGLAAEQHAAGVRYLRLPEWHRGGSPRAAGNGKPVGPHAAGGVFSGLKTAVVPFLQHELHSATFLEAVAAARPDIVHAHDFETLPAAVRAARRCGARVIYDMHELEEGRLPAAGRFLARWKTSVERRFIKSVSAAITVSPSIARFKASKYNIPLPTVVLNAPRLGAVSDGPSLRERCGLTAETPLAVYVGLVTEGRGIAELLAALALTPDLHLAMLGPARPIMRPLLERETARLGGRLHVLAPVPHDDVVAHIGSADLGVATIPSSCLSYEYCLPNKLFEMTLAGLPILVSSTTELSRFVADTGTGIAVDASDPAAIASGLAQVYAARQTLRPDAAKLDALRARFGWQRQAQHLLDVYQAVASGPQGLPVAMARRALATPLRPAGAMIAGT